MKTKPIQTFLMDNTTLMNWIFSFAVCAETQRYTLYVLFFNHILARVILNLQ